MIGDGELEQASPQSHVHESFVGRRNSVGLAWESERWDAVSARTLYAAAKYP